jgi:hypothetical protein
MVLVCEGPHSVRINEFAFSVANHLLTGMEEPPFDILVTFDRYLDNHADGYCYIAEEEDDPDVCCIDINMDLTEIQQATTIAHEMVHMRQAAMGVDYDEDEAYGLESELVEQYW